MRFDKTLKMIEVARQYGINTLAQLNMFLLVAQYEGCDLFEITGCEFKDKDYFAAMGYLNKLREGRKDKAQKGLNLVCYGEHTSPQTKELLLTPKGRELADRLASLV